MKQVGEVSAKRSDLAQKWISEQSGDEGGDGRNGEPVGGNGVVRDAAVSGFAGCVEPFDSITEQVLRSFLNHACTAFFTKASMSMEGIILVLRWTGHSRGTTRNIRLSSA